MARPSKIDADIHDLESAREAITKQVQELKAEREKRQRYQELRKESQVAKAAAAATEPSGRWQDALSPGLNWDGTLKNSMSAIRQAATAITVDMAELQVDQIHRDNQAKRDEVAALRASRAKGQPGHIPGQHNDDGSLR